MAAHRAIRILFAFGASLALGAGACGRFTPSSPPLLTGGGGGSGNGAFAAGFAGVRSAVGGDGLVAVSWDPLLRDGTPDPTMTYQVLVGPASSGYPEGLPAAVVGAGAGSATIDGVANGLPLAVAVRALDSQGNADGNGAFVVAIPGPVRYCDRAAPPGGDGLTPATPHSTLAAALASLEAAGGGNCYAAEGNYPEHAHLSDGAALYGGFAPGFDLAQRDPKAHPTVLDGSLAAGPLLKNGPGASLVVVDGVTADGANLASLGADLSGCDATLCNVTVRRCVSQGVRLQSGASGGQNAIQIHRSSVRENLGEGIEIVGNLDLLLTDSESSNNLNEGLEALPLAAPTGGKGRLVARRCRFHRNSNEGLDVKLDLFAPADPNSSLGARLDILLERCEFTFNRLAGAKIDLEFTDSAAIAARVLVDTCEFRANALEGLRLDLDARCVATVRGGRASANLGAGILLTGGPSAAVCQFSNVATLGNGGAGIQIDEGPVAASAIQITSALDALGAWTDAPGAGALANALVIGAAVPPDALATAAFPNDPPPLARIPRQALLATAVVEGTANFAAPTPFAAGDLLEIGDDGIARTVISVAANAVEFAPPVAEIPPTLAAIVFRWESEPNPKESFAPAAGLPVVDLGLPGTIDGDGTPADLGALGGHASALALAPAFLGLIELAPPPPMTPAPGSPVVLRFDAPLDVATLGAAPIRLETLDGAPLAFSASVVGAELRIEPAAPLPGPSRLLVGSALAGAAGAALAIPWVSHLQP